MARFVIAVLLLIFSAWFFYDGFIGFPKENTLGAAKHTDIDIVIQKVLGGVFTVSGAILLCMAMWRKTEKDVD